MPVERATSAVGGSPISVLTERNLPMLCDQVAKFDADFERIIQTFGYPPYWSRANTFESFVWFILEQQVSLASARAALQKLRTRIGFITPENVLLLDDDDMRAAYFSRQKSGYVRALAAEILDGRLDLTTLEHLSDHDVRARLVQ